MAKNNNKPDNKKRAAHKKRAVTYNKTREAANDEFFDLGQITAQTRLFFFNSLYNKTSPVAKNLVSQVESVLNNPYVNNTDPLAASDSIADTLNASIEFLYDAAKYAAAQEYMFFSKLEKAAAKNNTLLTNLLTCYEKDSQFGYKIKADQFSAIIKELNTFFMGVDNLKQHTQYELDRLKQIQELYEDYITNQNNGNKNISMNDFTIWLGSKKIDPQQRIANTFDNALNDILPNIADRVLELHYKEFVEIAEQAYNINLDDDTLTDQQKTSFVILFLTDFFHELEKINLPSILTDIKNHTLDTTFSQKVDEFLSEFSGAKGDMSEIQSKLLLQLLDKSVNGIQDLKDKSKSFIINNSLVTDKKWLSSIDSRHLTNISLELRQKIQTLLTQKDKENKDYNLLNQPTTITTNNFNQYKRQLQAWITEQLKKQNNIPLVTMAQIRDYLTKTLDVHATLKVNNNFISELRGSKYITDTITHTLAAKPQTIVQPMLSGKGGGKNDVTIKVGSSHTVIQPNIRYIAEKLSTYLSQQYGQYFKNLNLDANGKQSRRKNNPNADAEAVEKSFQDLNSELGRYIEIFNQGETEENKQLIDILKNMTTIEDSTKSLNLYYNERGFEGGSLGSKIKTQINTLYQLANKGFNRKGLNVSNFDEDWLIFATINASPNLLGGSLKTTLEQYYSTVAGLAMFSHSGAQVRNIVTSLNHNKITSNHKFVQLYYVNGFFVTQSYVLFATYFNLQKTIEALTEEMQSVAQRGTQVTIINPIKENDIVGMDSTGEGGLQKAWSQTYHANINNVALKITFLAHFQELIQELSNQLQEVT